MTTGEAPARLSAPLVVVGLGGNAISPPQGDPSLAVERLALGRAVNELAALARDGSRLLIVHGNGPQVGRLLNTPGLGDAAQLDVHVAQTQGELGYLLAAGLDAALGSETTVAVITRVVVDIADPAFQHPSKPVGPVLPTPPDGVASARTPDGKGWRRVVASPRPHAVIERAAIAELLQGHHVVAGGGGGVAVSGPPGARQACAAVIDKDWVAALLAIELDAERLLFVTDVSHAFDRFGHADQSHIHRMQVEAARARLATGVFAPGSMGPKVESAVQFVEASGRDAVIATVGDVAAALRGEAGTTIVR